MNCLRRTFEWIYTSVRSCEHQLNGHTAEMSASLDAGYGSTAAAGRIVVSVILEFNGPQRMFSVGLCKKIIIRKTTSRFGAMRRKAYLGIQSAPRLHLNQRRHLEVKSGSLSLGWWSAQTEVEVSKMWKHAWSVRQVCFRNSQVD